MTTPSFSSFKLAFLDSESRVRLNSDITEKYYSRIESIKFIGGFLENVQIEFSEHLNALIGGRGTGKSTLIECVRYALNILPISKISQEIHLKVVRQNLGSGLVELVVKSAVKHGKKYTITRRVGESPVVKDEGGSISAFSPLDLLPDVAIFGQNEIHEISRDSSEQLKVVEKFLNAGKIENESGISLLNESLASSRKIIATLSNNVSILEEDVEKLKSYEEDERRYKELGIDKQLKELPVIESERNLFKSLIDRMVQLKQPLTDFVESLDFDRFILSPNVINYPDKDIFDKANDIIKPLGDYLTTAIEEIISKIDSADASLDVLNNTLSGRIRTQEEIIEKEFRKLKPIEGMTGKQIGKSYRELIQNIESLKHKRDALIIEKELLDGEKTNRKLRLSELSESKSVRASAFEGGVKSLNRKLKNNVKVTYLAEKNRASLIKMIVGYRLPEVAEGRLSWMKDASDFSSHLLAETIRQGADSLLSKGWGMTPTTADRLSKISESQIMEIEEFRIDDLVGIELNVSGNDIPTFKSLDSLSTGQQCTALLHLLLLDNQDPLLLDQPEDNLDNAFIAERIVTQVRDAKLTRQFIFATHNANIPVFGDAEWIGVLESTIDKATLPLENQGSIDQQNIQFLAAKVLEGGEAAFNRRKEKYGFK